jgi:hypothetical protein
LLELVLALDAFKESPNTAFGALPNSLTSAWKKGDELLCDATPEAVAGGANHRDLVCSDSVLG